MNDDALGSLRRLTEASLFPSDGRLEVAGLHDAVSVSRDAYGTPSLDATSLDDLWFAQGLVTAGERLFQLDLTLRAATGRLSELFGERTFDGDRFVRTVGLHLAGRRTVEDWTDADHAMHGRFREGVRAWLALMPAPPVEYQLLGSEPDIPDEPAAWAACFAYLAWGLSNNWDKEILRARIRARAGDEAVRWLVPPTAGGTGRGSNAWVVAGSRTRSGRPLLANDPHLLAMQPGAWIELHLRAPGYEASGVALTFTPGVILGATPHHAWGATNVTGDVQDLLFVAPGADLPERTETIVVRGESAPRLVSVRETPDGPVLTHEPIGLLRPSYEPLEQDYALQWTGHTSGIRPTLALEVARAASFDEFRAAVREVGCPGQNFVYGDVDGTIGYQLTGVYPIRTEGDGTEAAEGPAWERGAWVPGEALPSEVDPPCGFIVTANDGGQARRSPHLISRDFHEPHRANRITGLLEARGDHDVASMAAIQADTVSIPARTVLSLLLEVVPRDEPQRQALALLAGWDGDLHADSAAAALYETWCDSIGRAVLEPVLGPDLTGRYLAWRETWRCSVLPRTLADPDRRPTDGVLLASLDRALAGHDRAGTWGELHRLVLEHPLASLPDLGDFFTAADSPLGGDEQTVAQAGIDGTLGHRVAVAPSWRVVWELGDQVTGHSVLPAGASGNPASPHWNDQLDLYLAGGLKPFAPARIDDGAGPVLRLVPPTSRT